MSRHSCLSPRSWSQKKQRMAIAGLVRPIGRPDLDNIIKSPDALNAITWCDDTQVVDVRASKRYSDRPQTRPHRHVTRSRYRCGGGSRMTERATTHIEALEAEEQDQAAGAPAKRPPGQPKGHRLPSRRRSPPSADAAASGRWRRSLAHGRSKTGGELRVWPWLRGFENPPTGEMVPLLTVFLLFKFLRCPATSRRTVAPRQTTGAAMSTLKLRSPPLRLLPSPDGAAGAHGNARGRDSSGTPPAHEPERIPTPRAVLAALRTVRRSRRHGRPGGYGASRPAMTMASFRNSTVASDHADNVIPGMAPGREAQRASRAHQVGHVHHRRPGHSGRRQRREA